MSTAKRAPLPDPPRTERANADERAANGGAEPAVAALADRGLLDHFAPAAVVVRRSGEIVHFYGAMERYISLPTGEATLDVLTLARDVLKPTLRAALHEAVRRNRPAAIETVDVGRDGSGATLRLTVRPLDSPHATERLWLMIFEELPADPARSAKKAKGATSRTDDLVRRLEAELSATKKEQRHLIEQLESGNEELKTANEEVLSMNEELQSTNEELVTSKEELQSMNEELTTLNAQLQEKVQEVTVANDDLANLLVSTDIATVFVDRECRVKRFTTAATALLNLLPSDVGRPINQVATNLVNVDLSGEARAILGNLASVEKEVDGQDGRHFILRVLPYKSEGHRLEGAVLTLSDVTTLKNTERSLVAAKAQVSADLRRMSRLHDVSTQLAGRSDLASLLDEIVRAAVEITHADMSSLEVLDEAGVLTLAAQSGFQPPLPDVSGRIPGGTGASAATLATRGRVVVEDIARSPVFRDAPARDVLLSAGVRAVQATALVGLSGRPVGVLSTHSRTPSAFSDDDLRWLDLLARQAADLIERRRLDNIRDRASDELERRVADRTRWLTLLHDVSQAITARRTGAKRCTRRCVESAKRRTGRWGTSIGPRPMRPTSWSRPSAIRRTTASSPSTPRLSRRATPSGRACRAVSCATAGTSG